MSREKAPVSLTIQIPRERYAQMLLEKRALQKAERRIPLIQEAMISRVNSFFQNVDFSKEGVLIKGPILIDINDEGDERKATAKVNGIKLASLAFWKHPDTDTFDLENLHSNFLTLCGVMDNTHVELTYMTSSVDRETGEEFEASFHGRVFREDDTPVNRAYGRITKNPLDISRIADALEILV